MEANCLFCNKKVKLNSAGRLANHGSRQRCMGGNTPPATTNSAFWTKYMEQLLVQQETNPTRECKEVIRRIRQAIGN